MRFEIVDIDADLAVIADTEGIDRGEVWFFMGRLEDAFGLSIKEFLAQPEIEEFLTELLIGQGLVDALDTKEFFTQFVREAGEGLYRGIWLNLPVALEFAGACRPALRHRLQQWLVGRFAAERQAVAHHLAEARYGATLH